jgi:peptide chain release factor 1
MHPKALELVKRYSELGERLGSMNPASSDYIKLAKDMAELRPLVDKYEEMGQIEKSLTETREMAEIADDAEMKQMAREEMASLEARKEHLDKDVLMMLLPKDPAEGKNVIVEIRGGTGGDEAALFAGDLFRMYTRWAESRKWKIEIMDYSETGLGGYKEVVFAMKGKDVYGHMKFESGVHRVQRVPETEAGGRVHTSTASVAVLPEVDEVEIHIDPKDLKIDTYRSGGAGGQYVNKTESAIRITHNPSGIVVACQEERSQIQNRAAAFRILRAKLYEMEMQKKMQEEKDMRKSMVGGAERAEKIRTYNYPQNRVTDHRVNVTLYKLEFIMNGDLDELINACIMGEQEAMLKSLE